MMGNYSPPIVDEEKNNEDMFTRAFTQKNDPAAVATSAARREYSRILGESRAQERSTQESYSDLFAKMRQSAFRTQQATPAQGFTGGMAEQGRQALSAAEMSQMGAVGRSREQALRDIRTGRQSAFSNALIAGQQQSDYARMLQDTTFQRQSQVENILAGDQDDDAKRRLLTSLGYSKEAIDDLLNEAESTSNFGGTITQQQQSVYDQLGVDPTEFGRLQKTLFYLLGD